MPLSGGTESAARFCMSTFTRPVEEALQGSGLRWSGSRSGIWDRSGHVRRRLKIGHWEGDTSIGSKRIDHPLAPVEWKIRFAIMSHP